MNMDKTYRQMFPLANLKKKIVIQTRIVYMYANNTLSYSIEVE